MSTLTIRRLDQSVHDRLRDRATRHGRSVEAEVREILAEAVDAPQDNLLATLRERIEVDACYADLDLPTREPFPRPVEFS